MIPLAAPAVDTAFTASRAEAVTWLQPSQAVADTGTMRHQHQEDRADAAGLAGPLAADLAVVV